MAPLVHSAQRAAYNVAIRQAIKYVKKDGADKYEQIGKLIDLVERLTGSNYPPEGYAKARQLLANPDEKWARFLARSLDELDDNVIATTLLNLGFETFIEGTKQIRENRKKYDCNIPWLILFDPTSACNLRCTGCWAAEYGHKLNLTYDEMSKLVSEGKELGTHLFLLTGGEPMVRKKDILRLAEEHNDCMYHIFTNGTLIDEEFCREAQRLGNIAFGISLEGFEEVNDGRRGAGVFDKVMKAFDLLKQYGLLFGVSICYTRANIATITSDEYLDMIIEKGCRYAWYFHYMPVGNDADVGGCIAGGRNYIHVNSNGDVEPCVFIHFSNANIREKSLLECLKQPLFEEYRNRQPFNKNLLRPCPMLENPEILQAMVKRAGAHSTDLTSPESAAHLCEKCEHYAEEWAPIADAIWAEKPHPEHKYENFKNWHPKGQKRRPANKERYEDMGTDPAKRVRPLYNCNKAVTIL